MKLPEIGGWQVDLLVQGFPGKSVENGGLGWSSIVLLRGHGRVVLVDTGSFSVRRTLLARLAEHGLSRHDVTDVLLTHAHYDHMMNWPLFDRASVAISKLEIDWALTDDIETSLSSELHVQALARSSQLRLLEAGEEALPGIQTIEAPGHTPHHLVFIIDDGPARLLLAADAVKNRAELLAGAGVSTLNQNSSAGSIARISALWRERQGAILVAGHDLPMRNDRGNVVYLGERRAGITAWLDADLNNPQTHRFDRFAT